ncbi:sensor domain-containing diguanylate cyclase [Litoribrevibacter albus]|uniref:GGDEF domain-containing protein n=1 Tax=Litoribrevibacter albus TaxID=1473156 RepID=A0AA37S9V3_9GAMM|nr:diguanylate cyclase [Litoribrevibacter albus]GLQ31011.1 hypothetical protein GCM10007876_14900 [Litoribrevibacter albus]
MTLVAKIATVITTAFITFLAIQYFNHTYLVSDRLDSLEKAFIQRELLHSESFLNNQQEQVNALTLDWATWDDSHTFLMDKNPDFIQKNLNRSSLQTISIHAFLWFNIDRELIHGVFSDNNYMPSESLLSDFLSQHPTLINQLLELKAPSDLQALSALLVFNESIYLVGLSKVLSSDGTGPSNGWLMALRKAPEKLLPTNNSGLDSFSELKPLELYASDSPHISNLKNQEVFHLEADQVTVLKRLQDAYGKSNIILSSIMPRTILEQSQKDFTALFTIELGVSFCVALLAFHYLRQHISTPISKLIREIEQAASLDRARISEVSPQSGELQKLIHILKGAIEQLNRNMVQEKANQVRIEQQNRILFELANDKDLTEGHLHQSFYKILSTLINQTKFTRASIWLMDKNIEVSECYACYSLNGDNIEAGTKVEHTRLTKNLLQKLIRQRSFITNLNSEITESILGTKVYEQAIISPIMISNTVSGALITEFLPEQKERVSFFQLFLASLSELCSNSLYAHERKQLHEQLNHMAHHDPLTKLPNRSLFEEIGKKTVARAKRENTGFGLLFVDLDKFKPVNDQYGHAVGDELLISFAERLKQRLRETDTIARIGGDEFLILLENTPHISDARIIATQIIEVTSQVFEIRDHHIRIGCSIGIAMYPTHGTTLEQLVSAGDQAMYKVKSTGRGSISVANEISKVS